MIRYTYLSGTSCSKVIALLWKIICAKDKISWQIKKFSIQGSEFARSVCTVLTNEQLLKERRTCAKFYLKNCGNSPYIYRRIKIESVVTLIIYICIYFIGSQPFPSLQALYTLFGV